MRRRIEKKVKALNAVKILVVISLIVLGMWCFLNFDSENKIKNKNGYFSEKMSLSNNLINNDMKKMDIYDTVTEKENKNEINNEKNNNTNQIPEKNVINESNSEEKVINEYKGYSVIAQLKIPKINLETYVLSAYNESALLISTTKFWGAEPNTVGNFCISGHNYINKNMFHNLKKLTIGDEIFLSTNKTGTLTYNVYDIYKVYPNETQCLSQNTNGKKEITLITCTSDSKKRIIVKAREKEV